MNPGLKIVYPPVTDFYTRDEVDNLIASVSGTGGVTSSGCNCDAAEVTFTISGNYTADGSSNSSEEYLTPQMTSNTSPSPYVISASNTYSTLYPWKAFNRTNTDNNDCWHATAGFNYGWLKVFLGTGNTKTVNKYRFKTRNESNTNYRCPPRDWTIEGSNNDSDWDVLDTRVDIDDPGQDQWTSWFTFINSTAYSYYRINITDSNGTNDNLNIGELHLVEADVIDSTNYINMQTNDVWQALIDLDTNIYNSITVTSGDIIDQMPSDYITELIGTGGIETTQSGTVWYVDGSTISGGGVTSSGCNCDAAEVTFTISGSYVADGSTNSGTGYATQVMASNTTPGPDVCDQSSVWGSNEASYGAWRAFDQVTGGPNDCWISSSDPSTESPQSIAYYFDTPRCINKFAYRTRNNTYRYSPRDFSIQRPADGVNSPDVSVDSHWTDLSSWSDIDDPGVSASWSSYFTFFNSVRYSAYRLRITDANQNDVAIVCIDELKLVEAQTILELNYINLTTNNVQRALVDLDTYIYDSITSTSGNIVNQIPSLDGYATESYVDNAIPTDYVTLEQFTTTSGDIINQFDNSRAFGNALFSVSGTEILHNVNNVNHYTSVAPAGVADFDYELMSYIGNVYVKKGANSDIVYKTGPAESDVIYFDWIVLV